MCDQRTEKVIDGIGDETEKPKTEINLSSLVTSDNLDVQVLSITHNFRPEIIRKLVLSRNGLSILPSSISKFTELKELDVSTNALTWISGEIAQLSKLKTLLARNNRLHNLPKDFQNCVSLEVLNLSGNSYTEFPSQLFQLKRLRDLHMGGNKIAVVQPDIGSMKR